jgi:hypothetical protein
MHPAHGSLFRANRFKTALHPLQFAATTHFKYQLGFLPSATAKRRTEELS